MTIFSYMALDEHGVEVSADMKADSVEDALDKVRAKGLYPTLVYKKLHKGWRKAIASWAKAFGLWIER